MSRVQRLLPGLAVLALTLTAARAHAASSVRVRSVDDIPPAPATQIRALKSAGSEILVTWTLSIDDARSFTPFGGGYVPTSGVNGYRVYRAAQGGDRELIATIPPGADEFTDRTPQVGTTYVYDVVAFDVDNETLPDIEPGSSADLARIVAIGGGPPDVVVRRTVKARMEFDVAIDVADVDVVEAFKGDFIALLAEVLGVDPARIIITGIEQGSTIVLFEIAEVEDDTSPPAEEVLAQLETIVADDTQDEFARIGPVLELLDQTEEQVVVIPQALDPEGQVILSWFSRQGDRVGLADFFLFADHFGRAVGDEGYDSRFDIVPDGAVGLADFFLFADEFGRAVVNAEEIQALAGQ